MSKELDTPKQSKESEEHLKEHWNGTEDIPNSVLQSLIDSQQEEADREENSSTKPPRYLY